MIILIESILDVMTHRLGVDGNHWSKTTKLRIGRYWHGYTVCRAENEKTIFVVKGTEEEERSRKSSERPL